jgi:hypothetical protein
MYLADLVLSVRSQKGPSKVAAFSKSWILLCLLRQVRSISVVLNTISIHNRVKSFLNKPNLVQHFDFFWCTKRNSYKLTAQVKLSLEGNSFASTFYLFFLTGRMPAIVCRRFFPAIKLELVQKIESIQLFYRM